mmetsp:Transcript_42476/g.138222  ORF Transcript_42476/g.138222 Transcript_42476/m.138222 type:complete len:202 (+) Transcript_42476:688-1293(+)
MSPSAVSSMSMPSGRASSRSTKSERSSFGEKLSFCSPAGSPSLPKSTSTVTRLPARATGGGARRGAEACSCSGLPSRRTPGAGGASASGCAPPPAAALRRGSSPSHALISSAPSGSRAVTRAMPRGAGAGPRVTAPVASYFEPWHGHANPPGPASSATSSCTRQPRCVHSALIAYSRSRRVGGAASPSEPAAGRTVSVSRK